MKNVLSRLSMGVLPILLGFSGSAYAQNGKTNAPLFDNLGSYHRSVSTKNSMAQRFFDQGFVLFYGFEWNESIRSFREAARLDPECGMCHWGLALSLLHKSRALDGNEYSDGKAAIRKALSLVSSQAPEERDFIQALALRYQSVPKMEVHADAFSCHPSADEGKAALKERIAYKNAMKKIVAKYPQDMDAKALYGAAVFWLDSGVNPSEKDPDIRTATKALADVTNADKSHPGAHHYYIHLVEPYASREKALPSADALLTLVPGSEHLVHMASHIYFVTGRYQRATEANLKAVAVFEDYDKAVRAQGFEPETNYLYFHDYDFLRSSSAMEGRKELTLQSVDKMVDSPFPSWLEKDATLQWFKPIPYFEKLRFGMWDDVLAESMPDASHGYATGMWHYARGMAYAHKGNLAEAEKELKALHAIALKREGNSTLGKSGKQLLNIAHLVLLATLSDSRGQQKAVISHLTAAMQIQDSMLYHEPPDWYFIVAQGLGDAYLKWGNPQAAKKMYEKSLRQYPHNGWSLYGLAKSLRQLGNTGKAAEVEEEFNVAWKNADIKAPIALFSR
jgi:tetratricopeptide (TPR) repeat protein